MIIFDTETTGLVKPDGTPLDQQPEIIEFAAVRVNQDLEIVDSIEFYCKPDILPLPSIITKITGITTDQVANEKPFIAYYKQLCEFFVGTKELVAHNCKFDVSLLKFALERIDKVCQFPWPPKHTCTVEATYHIKNRRLKLTQLYQHAFGKELPQKHRAMSDVTDLLEVVKWLREQKLV